MLAGQRALRRQLAPRQSGEDCSCMTHSDDRAQSHPLHHLMIRTFASCRDQVSAARADVVSELLLDA